MSNKADIPYDDLLSIVKRMSSIDELFNFFLRACETQNFEVCQLCLDAGANINIKEHMYHQTLLKVLVDKGTFTKKAADWLIEKGIDIDDEGLGGFSPLSLACYRGKTSIVKYLLGKGAKIKQYADGDCPCGSDLYNAVCSDKIEIVRLLLDQGVSLESEVRYESNPFIRAINRQCVDIVKLFLEKGVNLEFYAYGKTPLHYAVELDNLEIVRLLLEHGANVNARIQKSSGFYKKTFVLTALDIAIANNNKEMQALLLEYKATKSSKNSKMKALSDCGECERVFQAMQTVIKS